MRFFATLPAFYACEDMDMVVLTLLSALWFCLSISSGVFLLPNNAARAILSLLSRKEVGGEGGKGSRVGRGLA